MQDLAKWHNEGEYVLANVVVVDPVAGRTFPGFFGIKDGKIADGVSSGAKPSRSTTMSCVHVCMK